MANLAILRAESKSAKPSPRRHYPRLLIVTILGLAVFGIVVAIERQLVPAHIRKRFDDAAAKQPG